MKGGNNNVTSEVNGLALIDMNVSKVVQQAWDQASKKKKKKIRALRPSEIISKKRSIYPFDGKWLDSFGKPERHSKWFITGPSFSGKSSFVFMLCDYLARFGIVDYNNHEEAGGDAQTVASKIEKHVAIENHTRIRLYKAPIVSDTHETFLERLLKKNSADFAVLDSVQHAELDKRHYIDLTNQLCTPRKGKSIIFISHWVKNDYTKFLKHDADIKIEVIGFVANVSSRYGGGVPFLIWEEGAKKYWGKKYKQVIAGKYWPGIKR